jgi:indole-3-glycerol phosphate synthase
VLLIAALYDTAGLAELLDVCREADLAALVEVHDLGELMRALSVGASLIGINNRDLHTFQVDIATTERLAGLVPSDRLVVAESGLSSARDVARVYRAGARAALIGEVLMRETTTDGLSARVHELLREIPQ